MTIKNTLLSSTSITPVDDVLHVSAEGRKLIERFEGLRLRAYRCPAGVLTWLFGHTSAAGAPIVKIGMVGTKELADSVLSHDLLKFEAEVLALLKRKPTQHEFDALVSFAYNCGSHTLAKSSILSRFNRGDLNGASAAFLSYTHADGVELKGLKIRREAEATLFLRADHVAVHAALDYNSYEATRDDEGGAAQASDTPSPPKKLRQSKTAAATVTNAVSGLAAAGYAGKAIIDQADTVTTAVQSATTAAQGVHETAATAATAVGFGTPTLFLALIAVAIIVSAAFVLWDRNEKLTTDGV